MENSYWYIATLYNLSCFSWIFLKCDLSEKDNFNDNIKSVINEIFEEELKTEDKSKTVIKKTNLPHTDKNIKVLNKKNDIE